MKILVTGATGLVGHQVCVDLLRKGHQLVITSRKPEKTLLQKWELPAKIVHWESPESKPFPSGALAGVDGVIHLAGEPINQRWSTTNKERITNSRVNSTKSLVEEIRTNGSSVKFFISASAIGIYSNQSDVHQNESATVDATDAFLPSVCRAWEKASEDLPESVRRSVVRIGVVLAAGSGFLGALEPLFNGAIAGPIGKGKRGLSWIHLNDLSRLIVTIAETESMTGIYNGTAPNPCSNHRFSQIFSTALRVPNKVPVPPFALKALYGEMSALALSDQNIVPERVLQSGFKFNFELIEGALKDLYKWKTHYLDRRLFQWQWVNKPLETTFNFFKTPYNLETITPEFLNFKVLDSTTESVEKGTIINYKISLRGLPMKWQTEILEFVPNSHFIDNQNKGPYSKWHHTHRFEELAGGTYCTDEVIYRLPVGPLGALFGGSFVKSDVRKIFAFRFEKLRQCAESW